MQVASAIDRGSTIEVTDANGVISFVPKDEQNRDYCKVLAWQAGGGVIEPPSDESE